MTEKEAIEGLKPIVDNEAYTDRFQDVCRAAIKALEKQIAKKPIDKQCVMYQKCDTIIGKCFVCNSGVSIEDKYCSECGQKLDWGE